ncbi:MAG: hypothetical protein JNM78_06985 [Cyclobacteriaceae bacterium]|nr:hypothetical protein [Cyclobacteriaceae bacterium]
MKKLTFAIGMLWMSGTWAQSNETYLHNRYTIERIGAIGSTSNAVPILPPAPPKTEGDVYLNKTFDVSVFELYDQRLVEGFVAKLDLRLNEFDLITPAGIKVLKGNLVKSFICIDSLTKRQLNFVNVKEWKAGDNSYKEGFFEILAEGSITLVKLNELIFKKADFNPALNVGSQDNKYLKRHKFYYIADTMAMPLPNKKNVAKIFGKREMEMKAYMDQERTNVNNELDLIRLFNYHNGIL